MSSDTIKRVLSAIILIAIVIVVILLGAKACIYLVGAAGIILIDELLCNFIEKKRFGPIYFLAQSLYIVPYLYICFFSPEFLPKSLSIAIFVDILLLFYLFYMPIASDFIVKISKKFILIVPFVILFPFLSLSWLFTLSNWKLFLTALLCVNFGMDVGAWFFGRKFGKHKLWPEVSPKKTLEGVIGGVFFTSILGSTIWWTFFKETSLQLFIFFAFLGIMSQIGDLAQSKIKRQFGLKDSSTLIPGHGGIYDRVDSLIFLAPIFAISLKYFYFG